MMKPELQAKLVMLRQLLKEMASEVIALSGVIFLKRAFWKVNGGCPETRI